MRHLPVVFALLCTLPLSAKAEFVAEFESNRSAGDTPALSRVALSGQQMRTDAGRTSVLIDVRTGKTIVLLHDKRQYMDLDKVADQVSSAMATADAALAVLPPEQRAMVERQLGGASVAKTVVHMTRTAASDRVAGYGCQIYRTEIDGRHEQDACLANLSDAGISAADQATVRRAFQQMKSLGEKMSSGLVRSPLADMPTDKFPVRIAQLDGTGKPTQVSQLKTISTSPVNASNFKIPAGYTESSIADMGSDN